MQFTIATAKRRLTPVTAVITTSVYVTEKNEDGTEKDPRLVFTCQGELAAHILSEYNRIQNLKRTTDDEKDELWNAFCYVLALAHDRGKDDVRAEPIAAVPFESAVLG